MLSIFEKGFITLIRAAMLEKSEELPFDFDVDRIYDAARIHHIMGIVYKGAMYCGIDKSLPVMQKLFLGALKETTVHERQMHEFLCLKKAFAQNEIEYMPIKGVLVKRLYSDPSLRFMSDVDILIHKADYEKIAKILKESGYYFRFESDPEYVWTKKGALNLELHKSLVASMHKDFYSYLGEGWQMAIKKDNFEFYLKDEDEFIYLFCHFTKHYRFCGIGVKYIIDLWLYLKNTKLDISYIENEFDKLGILEFYHNILKVIDVWFADGKMDQKSEFISDFIIKSGVYGTHENEIASLVLQNNNNGKITAKKKLLVIRMFPPLKTMKLHYKYLNKAGFLLPLAWVCRGFRVLFKKRKNISKHIKDIKNINDSDVEKLKQNLEYVGLNLNFKG